MKKNVANIKGTIQESIIYEHKENTETINTTETTGTVIALQNYRYKGDYLENVKKFIVSSRIENNILLNALKEKPKQNDRIISNGISWRVLECTESDVDIDILCIQSSYAKTTKSVSFR